MLKRLILPAGTEGPAELGRHLNSALCIVDPCLGLVQISILRTLVSYNEESLNGIGGISLWLVL